MKNSMIILLPNLLSESLSEDDFLPQKLKSEVEKLDGLIAESRKGGIRYLLRFLERKKANEIPLFLLNEHTKKEEIEELFQKIKKGGVWGLVSDAGLPCIADPGSSLVALAHKHKISIKALSGPCSITQAIMVSGLSGQSFCFHGYLPKDEADLIVKIKKMEKLSREERSTQIFIETPYRVDKLLNILLKTLSENVRLCVAQNLTTENEKVFCFEVKEWKKSHIVLGKEVSVFLFV